VLVYYHGGGFCLCSAFDSTYHAYLNRFAALADVLVVSVEYRLAPEHPVPSAYADSWKALAWVVSHHSGGDEPWLTDHADFSRLYLGGDSAGANIAHHMAMRVGAEGLAHGAKIHGVLLIHPYFLGSDKVGSDDLDRTARERLGRLWRVTCPVAAGEDDPLINPLADSAPGLEALACGRVLVCVAEDDVLRDRGKAYYDRLLGTIGWRRYGRRRARDTGSTCLNRAAARPSRRTWPSAPSSTVKRPLKYSMEITAGPQQVRSLTPMNCSPPFRPFIIGVFLARYPRYFAYVALY
jgi:hypothetical protein